MDVAYRTETPPAESFVTAPTVTHARPRVGGKFIFVGDEKFYVRGVTYGPFRPDASGSEYHDRERVARDMAQMRAHGINAIRTYTVPPRWLLDLAQRFGLRVMVGLPWEQHIAFLDDPGRAAAIEKRVRDGIRACAQHPAILCYAIGNEIPAPIVRWHGARRIQRFISRLYRAAKQEDSHALVTYVNYPSTEYLQLPFLDLVCFNIYLESPERFEAYLARLQNIAGDRPLILSELGLDSRRHGRAGQARALDWQIRAASAGGTAGAFVFSWTDEWHRGGAEIDDWDFGLTDREQKLKPALSAVRDAFADVPFPLLPDWPRVSVVVCSFNGSRTIRDCLNGIARLEYPNYEVIVVDDGSRDATAAIAAEFGARVIRTENQGLSCARNTGAGAASGEIIAFLDDDAYPDPHWLTYLATSFRRTDYCAFGGPNIAPQGDGLFAQCVDNAPGNPIHVLVSDQQAEHIPGCNFAILKSCLQAVGGFDPQFRVAGDDVDLCWRLQQRGCKLGFSPAAMVWHHRRKSLRSYWKQQTGYGKAEALLEAKWPEKYNNVGQLTWSGRIYGKGLTEGLASRQRIYQGTWGSSLFQSVYPSAPSGLVSLALMPEWYLVILALAALTALGVFWTPLFWFAPLLALSIGMPLVQAVRSASNATFTAESHTARIRMRALIALLHLVQPLARLVGRRWEAKKGEPWSAARPGWPWPRTFRLWSEKWQAADAVLQFLVKSLRTRRAIPLQGGPYDRWDLEVRGGTLGAARLLLAIEEHGGGKQQFNFRLWPRLFPGSVILTATLLGLTILAGFNGARVVTGILASLVVLLGVGSLIQCALAMGALEASINELARTLEVKG